MAETANEDAINSGSIPREDAIEDLRKARERAKQFRGEAESRAHKEYWGGRLSAYNMAIDLLEENHERV